MEVAIFNFSSIFISPLDLRFLSTKSGLTITGNDPNDYINKLYGLIKVEKIEEIVANYELSEYVFNYCINDIKKIKDSMQSEGDYFERFISTVENALLEIEKRLSVFQNEEIENDLIDGKKRKENINRPIGLFMDKKLISELRKFYELCETNPYVFEEKRNELTTSVPIVKGYNASDKINVLISGEPKALGRRCSPKTFLLRIEQFAKHIESLKSHYPFDSLTFELSQANEELINLHIEGKLRRDSKIDLISSEMFNSYNKIVRNVHNITISTLSR